MSEQKHFKNKSNNHPDAYLHALLAAKIPVTLKIADGSLVSDCLISRVDMFSIVVSAADSEMWVHKAHIMTIRPAGKA
jgi:sRNA-binding regulator protein Hfq